MRARLRLTAAAAFALVTSGFGVDHAALSVAAPAGANISERPPTWMPPVADAFTAALERLVAESLAEIVRDCTSLDYLISSRIGRIRVLDTLDLCEFLAIGAPDSAERTGDGDGASVCPYWEG